ncbi:hypothetical protein UMNF18_pP7079 (plasmid) [Escherichia coli UMNF18]|nr:hypothetical protein UMNF18_pP7079 [Escherichia coli UMNF18]
MMTWQKKSHRWWIKFCIKLISDHHAKIPSIHRGDFCICCIEFYGKALLSARCWLCLGVRWCNTMTAKRLVFSQMVGMAWIACKKPQIKPVSNMGSLKQYISIARTLTLILRPVRVFRIPSGNVSLKYERLEYCS